VVDPTGPAPDAGSAGFGASHAPPIDVVGHFETPTAPFGGGVDLPDDGVTAPDADAPNATGGWDAWWTPHPTPDGAPGQAWQPPADTTTDAPPPHMIEFVDEFVVESSPVEANGSGPSPAVALTDAERFAAGIFAPAPGTEAHDATPTTNGHQTAAWAGSAPFGVDDDHADTHPANSAATWAEPATETAGNAPDGDDTTTFDTPLDAGLETPWGHHPDAEATSTGFYVDWGTDAAAGDLTDAADPWVAAALDRAAGEATSEVLEPTDGGGPVADPAGIAGITGITDFPGVTDLAPERPLREAPTPISWRPLADTVLTAVAVDMTTRDLQDGLPHAPTPLENFVSAGSEWDLGNALPLVEVRGEGGLVMRRADERWALADVRSTPSFALEVDVDFRSGPGFGVLFCAGTDGDGHMSGYSFDVDPIHEGGSYLIRQWQADRELWNPIAHAPAVDPTGMHGALMVRVVLLGDSVTASVNGTVVLDVASLERACADRNREPATGDRVGIQAWSSSDVAIDTLRVAPR